MLKDKDYHEAFKTAIDACPDLPRSTSFQGGSSSANNLVDIHHLLQRYTSEIEDATGERPTVFQPFGDFRARIGIVLEHGYFRKAGTKDSATDCSMDLTWGIYESGFTKSNILVWPFNFRQRSSILSSNQVKPFQASETQILGELNRDLIEQSDFKVILMCSDNVERIVLPNNKSDLSITSIGLEFRGYSFKTFLEIDGLVIKRIYLATPAFLTLLWTNKWSRAVQIGGLFRFSAVTTETKGIFPLFVGLVSDLHFHFSQVS